MSDTFSAPGGVVAVLAVAALLATSSAVLDASAGALVSDRPLRRAPGQAFRSATRLLLQQRRTTVRPDPLLWRVAVAAIPVLGVMAAAVLPLDGRTLISTSADLVWFNAMEALLWAALWLSGWGPNAVFGLVGGYRFLALGLSYELPFMFVLVSVGVGAESLRMADVVEAQDGLWFAVTMPVAFVVYLVAVSAFSFWGPFAVPVGRDLSGGVAGELSGVDRLVLLAGRYLVLGVGAAFAVPLFLGGGAGPLLPEWAWEAVKTVAVLTLLVAAGWRWPAIRPDRLAETGWMVLLPATLGQVLVASLLVL